LVRIKKPIGRFGNNLFQYASARMLAERNGLYLDAQWWHEDILKVLPWNNKGKRINPSVEITDNEYIKNRNCLFGNFKNHGVVLNGYFQDSAYYYHIRDKIKTWFEPCTMPDTNEWVCHYRVSDYWMDRVGSVISPDWYVDILKNEKFSKVHIVTEDIEDPCVRELSQRVGAEIHQLGVKDSFNFLRSAKNIICSNGSFSWWAAFLGNWEKCYMFAPWMKFHHNMSLRFPGVRWIDGQFAENEKMKEKWTNFAKNGLENYWQDWKK
jgi:hypothetical protein